MDIDNADSITLRVFNRKTFAYGDNHVFKLGVNALNICFCPFCAILLWLDMCPGIQPDDYPFSTCGDSSVTASYDVPLQYKEFTKALRTILPLVGGYP